MSATEGKGRQEETIEIKKSIVIDASPEVVFKAITDPNELTNWFPDQAILEPRVGGRMIFSFYKKQQQRGGRGDYIEGTVIDFTPNKKLAYTWEIPDLPDSKSVVTWELEEIDNNKTRLNLTQTGIKLDKVVKEADAGWTYFLNELVKYCGKTK